MVREESQIIIVIIIKKGNESDACLYIYKARVSVRERNISAEKIWGSSWDSNPGPSDASRMLLPLSYSTG